MIALGDALDAGLPPRSQSRTGGRLLGMLWLVVAVILGAFIRLTSAPASPSSAPPHVAPQDYRDWDPGSTPAWDNRRVEARPRRPPCCVCRIGCPRSATQVRVKDGGLVEQGGAVAQQQAATKLHVPYVAAGL